MHVIMIMHCFFDRQKLVCHSLKPMIIMHKSLNVWVVPTYIMSRCTVVPSPYNLMNEIAVNKNLCGEAMGVDG